MDNAPLDSARRGRHRRSSVSRPRRWASSSSSAACACGSQPTPARCATAACSPRTISTWCRARPCAAASPMSHWRAPPSCSATARWLPLNLVRRLKPAAVVGFGGYPTLPPLMAARLLGVPGIIHDANAVLGRANRFLSAASTRLRTSLPGVLDRDPASRRQGDDRRHADAPGDPRRRRGAVCVARTERAAAATGGRRQPGRAGDERYRAGRNRAAGADAVEPA